MKKYSKITPLFSIKKLIIASLYPAIVAVAVACFAGFDNYWFVICIGLFSCLFIITIMEAIPTFHKYSYDQNDITIYYSVVKLKKITYNDVKFVCITNAIYNTYKYSGSLDYALGKKVVDKDGKKSFLQYPYMTLHSSNKFIKYLKPSLNSRELLWCDKRDGVFLGVCWFDSFRELLDHVVAKTYIVEDVYLRYKNEFDDIILQNPEKATEFFIAAEKIYNYTEYNAGRN